MEPLWNPFFLLWPRAQRNSCTKCSIVLQCTQTSTARKTRAGRKPYSQTPSTPLQIRRFSSDVSRELSNAKQRFVPQDGTYPLGFSVSGLHVGVKSSNTSAPDLALVTSDKPCSAAAVFTTNKFQAAPVVVSRETLELRNGEGIRAVVANAGCANAVTGQGGLNDAHSMASTVDACLSSGSSQLESSTTLVMGTGVIGQRLPIAKILDGIPKAYSTRGTGHESWLTTARSICTTDTFPKLLSTTFTLPSTPTISYRLAGMCKGSGMMHPNMATLLGILCTDAPIPSATLRPLLANAVERSFNSISIDGDTSTNDTVAILANGAAGGPALTSVSGADFDVLQDTVTQFSQKLSHLLVRDGEGATKFVHISVTSALSYKSAKQIASTIARSPLVKTALYGRDANWGRILCAIGYTQGIEANAVLPERTSVSLIPKDGSPALRLLVNGEPENVDEQRAAEILKEEDLEILVELGTGEERASYWFCDFSHDYVTINGDYRT